MSSTAAASSDDGAERRPRTLLEEVEEAMAQSLLVFLVADLRLMSATGRVETKYETIAIASDPPTRSTAAELAGLAVGGSVVHQDDNVFVSQQRTHATQSMLDLQQDGLSPAQIMAVVIIELYRTVKAQEQQQEQDFKDESFDSWKPDGKRGTRAKDDDMHSLLRAYAQMIGEDIKTEIPHVEKRRSLMNLTQPVEAEGRHQTKMEPIDEGDEEQDDDEQETQEPTGREKVAAEAKKRVREKVDKPVRRANAMRKTLVKDSHTKAKEEFEEVTDALFRMGKPSRSLRASLNQSLGGERNDYFTKDELVDFMEKAVESRLPGKLSFLAGFFRDGTVSKLMAQSNVRVVWMNDWYPLKDLTYAIAVDQERKRVLVVFRGAITKQDWSKAVESRNLREVPNPIDEDYPGKTPTVSVSKGFYQYLGRVRKDTGTVKYDEIANLAYKYGKERIGDDFELVVNGHSLGGALSTTFSFFASTDERFTSNGPVKCVNFGAPYVGGVDFMRAFQHQEQRQKLIYVRMFNHNDIVAHLPPNMRVTSVGGKFRHVGIGVRLPSVPTGCLYTRVAKWKPDVFYIKEEGFVRSYWRAIRDNFILKFPLPAPWKFAKMHKLEELQRRLMYGSKMGGGEQFELLQKPIEEVYDKMVGTSYGADASAKFTGDAK